MSGRVDSTLKGRAGETQAQAAGAQAADAWLTFPKPNAAARLRLYCFHYAGGGAHAFRSWTKHLPDSIEVCAVQLPGRGARMWESPFTNYGTLLPTLAEIILPTLTKPFALLGHSMGAMIAFEMARQIRRAGTRQPVHLFVSGRGGPRARDLEVNLSELPEDDLIAELIRYEGAPKELLENRDLMHLLLPTIRADFKICETYDYVADEPLECPVSAFGGLADFEVSRARLEEWRAETRGGFTLRMLPGGHFYLQSAEQTVLRFITDDLRRFL
jgi:medium-chain acyl-[acyl-carrier-protein] hydrolase